MLLALRKQGDKELYGVPMYGIKTFLQYNVQHILAPQVSMIVLQMWTDWKRRKVSIHPPPLPSHINRDFLLGCSGEDPE